MVITIKDLINYISTFSVLLGICQLVLTRTYKNAYNRDKDLEKYKDMSFIDYILSKFEICPLWKFRKLLHIDWFFGSRFYSGLSIAYGVIYILFGLTCLLYFNTATNPLVIAWLGIEI